MDNKYIYSLTVLSIVLVFSSLSYSQDVENKACNVIQITQGEEDSRNPFVCGDGSGILFLSRADLLNNGHPNQTDVFFADITDPFNPIFYQLTNTPESESGISISDDCTQIAFGSESDLTGGNPLNEDQLFYGDINNPNNPIYTQLTNVDDESFSPRISGDGTKIAFGTGADITGMNPLQSFEYFIFDDNNLVVPFEQLTNSLSGGGIFSGPVTNTAATRVAFIASANYVPPNMNADGARELYLSEIDFNSPNPPMNTLYQLTQLPGPGNNFFNQGADINSNGQRIVFASNYAITGMSPDPERDIFIADVGDPQNPVFTRITKSAEFTASSAEIDSAGNNIVFITDNPQFAPVKDGDTETIVMANIINPANPSFMSLANFPPGTDLDDLSAPNEFTFFAFESDNNLVSNTNVDETEEIFILLTDQCNIIGVPTLSQWGLIAMTSILGIVGFMVARRRKVNA